MCFKFAVISLCASIHIQLTICSIFDNQFHQCSRRRRKEGSRAGDGIQGKKAEVMHCALQSVVYLMGHEVKCTVHMYLKGTYRSI